MRNETIRYWMKFVQEDLPVKHLFVQNRFLNIIDPEQYAWRWNENQSSDLDAERNDSVLDEVRARGPAREAPLRPESLLEHHRSRAIRLAVEREPIFRSRCGTKRFGIG